MKKLATIFLSILFVFMLTSCTVTTDSVIKNLDKEGYTLDIISNSSGDEKLQLKQIKIRFEDTYNVTFEGDIITVIEAVNDEDQRVYLYEFEKESDAVTFYDIILNSIESEKPEKVIDIDECVVIFASDSKALSDAK
ncbi:MAG: hypothetical protein IJZ93_05790 [Clostridia bacterium]|nr:hypothetical protein [Clostridia bacterium]